MKIFKNTRLFSPGFALLLILLFGIPRFILVLGVGSGGGYRWVSILFVLMILFPFVMMDREQRKLSGIRKFQNRSWLFYSLVLGLSLAFITWGLGQWLYGNSDNNWFFYISQTYNLPPNLETAGRLQFFLIYSLIGISFSPLGEEFLYRGVIHQGFVKKFGETRASMYDSLAFALTHLAHFGIIWTGSGWEFRFLPALAWFMMMYTSARIFFLSRVYTGSIWGAVIAHAGFNLGMTFCIFFLLR